jgi:hypothetical protein
MYGLKEKRRIFQFGTSRKRIEGGCRVCKVNLATVWSKPTGGWFIDGVGMCTECYEREIRSTRVGKKINRVHEWEEEKILAYF